MAFQAQQRRGLVHASAGTPSHQRQGQGGQQRVGDAAVEQAGQGGEQSCGGVLVDLDVEAADRPPLVDGRIEVAGAEQRVGAVHHLLPVREFGQAPLGPGLLGQRMRPAPHRGADLGQRRGGARRYLGPGGDQVLHQNSPGHAVDREVVCDDDQASRSGVRTGIADGIEPDELEYDAVGGIQAVHRGVEFGLRVFAQVDRVGGVEGRAVHECVDVHRAGVGHPQPPAVIVCPQSRSQHVVSVDRGGECGDELRAVDADRQLQDRCLGEPVEIAAAFDHVPDDRGEWQVAGAAAGQFLECLERLGGIDNRAQRRDRAVFEHLQRCAVHPAQLRLGDQLDGEDAVAAEGEEGVVDADLRAAEQFGEDLGEHQFGRRLRGAVRGVVGDEHRFRQCFSIELADRVDGDLVQDDKGGGDHIGGQGVGRRGTDVRDIELGAGHPHQVGGEGGGTGRTRNTQCHSEIDTIDGAEHRVDLAEFDALATYLHLEVGATEVFQRQSGGRASTAPDRLCGTAEFTGAAERVGDESLRGQLGRPW